jgi:hypothetical protein
MPKKKADTDRKKGRKELLGLVGNFLKTPNPAEKKKTEREFKKAAAAAIKIAKQVSEAGGKIKPKPKSKPKPNPKPKPNAVKTYKLDKKHRIKIINPVTGKKIDFLGATHLKLIKTGVIPVKRIARGEYKKEKVITNISKNGMVKVYGGSAPPNTKMTAVGSAPPNTRRPVEESAPPNTKMTAVGSAPSNARILPSSNEKSKVTPTRRKRQRKNPKAKKEVIGRSSSNFTLGPGANFRQKGTNVAQEGAPRESNSAEEGAPRESKSTEEGAPRERAVAENRPAGGKKLPTSGAGVGAVGANNLSKGQGKIAPAPPSSKLNIKITQQPKAPNKISIETGAGGNKKQGGNGTTKGKDRGLGLDLDLGTSSSGTNNKKEDQLYDKALKAVYDALDK